MKESWREVAAWARAQLARRYGDAVRVIYFDLFDPACPALPPGAQLPLVLVDGELVSSGGKISLPTIRRRLEAQGILPRAD
jgi:disulfide oxidoreductase YuzD